MKNMYRHTRRLILGGFLFLTALLAQNLTGQELTIQGLDKDESGVLHFSVSGPAAKTVVIEQSSNLEDWLPVSVQYTESGSFDYTEVPGWSKGDRYYRVRAGAPATVTQETYHDWEDAFILNNGVVEAAVAPTVGRVMQFRFIGEDGPFWENRSLDGTGPAPGWGSSGGYGGDKAWPSPQSIWGWPPPTDFDGAAYVGSAENGGVTLVGPVDDEFGIRVTRTIQLVPDSPSMIINTAFERVEVDELVHGTKTVGVWVVTQMNTPEGMFAPVPEDSIFGPLGYVSLGNSFHPRQARNTDGLLRFLYSTSESRKIGLDGDSLLWMDATLAVRFDSPRVPGAEYPDENSSTEIYTNPNPSYVEMELMGPLDPMPLGSIIERPITYTLIPRTEDSVMDEARKIYGME